MSAWQTIRGHPSIKYLRNKNPKFRSPPCTHLYAFKYSLPSVRTHFRYWILYPINYTKPKYQLLYLIPGAILCSKFNYSDVTSIKPFITSIIFIFLFYRENFQKWKIYSRNAYVLTRFNPLLFLLYTPLRFCHDSPSPYLRTYFIDGP